MNCTRCEGTGFLNHMEDVPKDLEGDHEAIRVWMINYGGEHDMTVCDCCGNGYDAWHGSPGEHYTVQDPWGKGGPYDYNGGLCECH